jgi:hypothetical protein
LLAINPVKTKGGRCGSTQVTSERLLTRSMGKLISLAYPSLERSSKIAFSYQMG